MRGKKGEYHTMRKPEIVSLRQPERPVSSLGTGKYAKLGILALGQQSREKEMAPLEALIKNSLRELG